MYPGLDPNFFPPTEAVEMFSENGQAEGIQRIFKGLAFRNPVPTGGVVSGFVLTNLDEGVKIIQVDLVGNGQLRAFSFLVDVPGFRADYHARDTLRQDLYASADILAYDNDAAFRAALEQLPCCTTSKNGTRDGDPLNPVLVGGPDDVFPVLARRGWQPTE